MVEYIVSDIFVVSSVARSTSNVYISASPRFNI